MAEPKPHFAKQSSARRAQWKEKPKDFISMAEPKPHFAKQRNVKQASIQKKDFAKKKRQGKVLFRVVDINLVSLWKLQSAHPKDSMFVHREDGL